jgi:hypothetical protein
MTLLYSCAVRLRGSDVLSQPLRPHLSVSMNGLSVGPLAKEAWYERRMSPILATRSGTVPDIFRHGRSTGAMTQPSSRGWGTVT